ncbi:hypothetical protein [Ralstonia holmesii]|uniref:hypothetical protein n=1 Tax=Ralstonia holmesii TaxID=3058602 RepID=UPI003D6608DF
MTQTTLSSAEPQPSRFDTLPWKATFTLLALKMLGLAYAFLDSLTPGRYGWEESLIPVSIWSDAQVVPLVAGTTFFVVQRSLENRRILTYRPDWPVLAAFVAGYWLFDALVGALVDATVRPLMPDLSLMGIVWLVHWESCASAFVAIILSWKVVARLFRRHAVAGVSREDHRLRVASMIGVAYGSLQILPLGALPVYVRLGLNVEDETFAAALTFLVAGGLGWLTWWGAKRGLPTPLPLAKPTRALLAAGSTFLLATVVSWGAFRYLIGGNWAFGQYAYSIPLAIQFGLTPLGGYVFAKWAYRKSH